jgi:hypothetical protein
MTDPKVCDRPKYATANLTTNENCGFNGKMQR